MNRRNLIAAGAAVVTISGSALAQTSHEHNTTPSSLFDAASNCVKAGLVCSDHCLQTFAAGDASLAACARRRSDGEFVRDTVEAREPQFILSSGDGEGRAHRVSGLRDGMPQARREASTVQGMRRGVRSLRSRVQEDERIAARMNPFRPRNL